MTGDGGAGQPSGPAPGSGAGPEATSGVGSGLDGAYAALHLAPGAPLPVVRAAYRALAARHHPDVGGDPEAMRRLNAAYGTLRASHRARARREAAARLRRYRTARKRRERGSWKPRRPTVLVALLLGLLVLAMLAVASGVSPGEAGGASSARGASANTTGRGRP